MSTVALELALALHKAPIQRFALRDRPLPDDMAEVLQLASAMQPQLQDAANLYSLPEETIVEAVRFYLYQVLFESGTDAYRHLGLRSDASDKLIRQHHIWLLRWLHPDRCGEDWESALAIKVNWAWQQLRSDAARLEYDQSRTQASAQAEPTPLATSPASLTGWSVSEVKRKRHWLRRIVATTALLACCGLFWLAMTRQDRVDPDAIAGLSREEDAFPDLPAHPGAMARSAVEASAVKPPLTSTQPAQVESRDLSAPTSLESGRRSQLQATLVAETSGQTQAKSIPVDSARPNPVREESAHSTQSPIPKVPRVARVDSATAVTVAEQYSGSPAEPSRVPVHSELKQSASVPLVARARKRTSAPSSEPLAKPAGNLPVEKGESLAVKESGATSDLDATVANANSFAKPQAEGPAPDLASEPIAATPQTDTLSVPTDEPGPEALSQTGEAQGSDASLAKSDAVERNPSAHVGTSAELDRATLARFELARDGVRHMVSFLRSAGGNPPEWVNESARLSIIREKEALYQRNVRVGSNRFVMDPPVWNISDSAVSLRAIYHLYEERTPAESGRVSLDMEWGDDRWLVKRIEIAPES